MLREEKDESNEHGVSKEKGDKKDIIIN